MGSGGVVSAYVVCPAKITSPAPSEGFMETSGLGPNHPCGLRVALSDDDAALVRAGAPMVCRCGRGHQFYAHKDVREAVAS